MEELAAPRFNCSMFVGLAEFNGNRPDVIGGNPAKVTAMPWLIADPDTSSR